jgi:hypothetical protein
MLFGHAALRRRSGSAKRNLRILRVTPGWSFCADAIEASRASASEGVEQTMKRIATWVVYAVGALAIAYLALYAYATFSGRHIVPGDPIHIFRNPDAPSYS